MEIFVSLREGARHGEAPLFLGSPLAWSEVEYLPSGQCAHGSTACDECLVTWALDHFVAMPQSVWAVAMVPASGVRVDLIVDDRSIALLRVRRALAVAERLVGSARGTAGGMSPAEAGDDVEFLGWLLEVAGDLDRAEQQLRTARLSIEAFGLNVIGVPRKVVG